MIGRALALIGGIAGAGTLSQYPEFAQQYTQRLAGQIQALETVVADFDATAERSGLTRESALAQMTGTTFLADRGADLRRTIDRYTGLQADYALLNSATAVEKILMPHRLTDAATFRGTWVDYEPALPLTTAGAVSSGVGFLGGWLAVGGALWLVTAPFRMMRRARRMAPLVSAVPAPFTEAVDVVEPDKTPAKDEGKPLDPLPLNKSRK